MSLRTEINKIVRVDDEGSRNMTDVTLYATTASEAKQVKTSDFLIGSTLIVLQTASVYMLDADGGEWRSVKDGSRLN